MKYPEVVSKSVLVTGCSSGIGLATARLLRDRGWAVLPTARKPEDMDRLRSEGFNPVQLDVTDSAAIHQTANDVLRLFGGRLGALVNNAGYGQPGAMEDMTRDAMREQFEVNVFGLQELTNQLVPAFRRQGYGRIVNVSSVLGRISIPFMGIYSASKYAVEAMSDAMRVELWNSGIAVSLVEPGPIETAFRKTSKDRALGQQEHFGRSHFEKYYREQVSKAETKEKLTHVFMLPPEAVARKILHALESPRPRRRYPVTAVAYVIEFLRHFVPDGLIDRVMSRRLA
jgi:NAD(P)-dependent dehydrogenase (short-subunit alcohol dehydrogenase family)